MGGSVGGASSVSSYQSAARSADLQALRPGTDDDPAFGATAAITKGVFGVLYTVCKEKHVSLRFAAFRLFMDWLQLFLLTVNPSYGFNINSKSISWQILYFIQLNDFMKARGYAFFLACLYIMVAGLFTAVLVSVWVGWSFHNNRFDHVWPIVFLKWFATLFFQTLDIASVTLFLIAMDCQYFDRPADVIGYNQEFAHIHCWSMPHLIHVVVAVVSLVVFVAMAWTFSMAEMDLNLLTTNVLAQAHTRVELITFTVKVVMTLANVFVNSNKWLAGINIVGSYIMLWTTFFWVPHYVDNVNLIRVGTYSSTLWTSIMMALVVWAPGNKSLEHVKHMREIITIVTYAGVPCAAALGAGATWLRLRWFKRQLPRFREINPNTHPADVYEFCDPREVEILARCCRKWAARDQLDPAAVALATAVMKNGMSQLQKQPFMIILYSSFLIEVQTSYQSGYKMLQSAKKCDPSLLERFAIFAREQQHTQKGAAAPGEATDLVAHVEFQRNYAMALRVHKDALLSMRAFWGLLLHSSISFTSLTKAVKTMDVNIRHAESVYRMVMQRHANNARMVRMYAKFMEHVKNDPWASSKWFMEADRLKEIEETQRTNNMVFVGGDADPALQEALTSDTEERGIIVANAMGEIQMANSTLHTMLGYARQELQKKNISALMPAAVSAKHSTFVHNYITSGRERFLHRWNDVVVVNKDKTMMPVRLQVAKLSGLGEDTVFIGLFEHVKQEQDVACVWVGPNSQVVAVDPNFTDWLGHPAGDVVGVPLWQVVGSRQNLERVLLGVRAEFLAPNGQKRPPASARVSELGKLSRPSTAELRTGDAVKRPSSDGDKTTPHHQEQATSPSPGPAQRARRASVIMTMMKKGMGMDTGGNLEEAQALQPNAVKSLLSQRWGPAEQHRAVGVDDGAMEGPFEGCCLGGVQFLHKYLDQRPVELDVTISNGGMGSFTFQKLTLHKRVRTAPPLLLGSTAPPSDNLMVVLCKGRVVHVTNALAAWLGTTPKAIIASSAATAAGAGNPLDTLLPEPFATLHSNLAVGGVSRPAHIAPPTFSCRSGRLSVPLATTGQHGQDVLPFRLDITRTAHADTNTYHVVRPQPTSLQEAFAERRVMIVLDHTGKVKRISSHAAATSAGSIFGFDPSLLVGHNVTEFVDVFRITTSSTPVADHRGDGDADKSAGNRLLATLVAHANTHPGAAWCVGVLPPITQPELDRLGSLSNYVLKTITMPAVMTLSVNIVQPPLELQQVAAFKPMLPPRQPSIAAERTPLHSIQRRASSSHPTAVQHSMSMRASDMRASPLEPAASSQPAHLTGTQARDAAEDLNQAIDELFVPDELGAPGKFFSPDPCRALPGSVLEAGNTAARPATSPTAARNAVTSAAATPPAAGGGTAASHISPFAAALMANQGALNGLGTVGLGLGTAMEIEMHLWRTDTAVSIIDVDGDGKASTTPDLSPLMQQLYPAGLLLGVSAERMAGRSVSLFLTPLKGRSVSDLFVDPTQPSGKGDDDAHVQKRSNLKQSLIKPKAQESARRATPPMPLKIKHTGDGLELPLTLQVVGKEGLDRGCFLILRVDTPRCGRPDLAQYLAARADRGSNRSVAAGASTPHSLGRSATNPQSSQPANLGFRARVPPVALLASANSGGNRSMPSAGGDTSARSGHMSNDGKAAPHGGAQRSPPKLTRDSDAGDGNTAQGPAVDWPHPPHIDGLELPRMTSGVGLPTANKQQIASDEGSAQQAAALAAPVKVRFGAGNDDENEDYATAAAPHEAPRQANRNPRDPVANWVMSNGSSCFNQPSPRSDDKAGPGAAPTTDLAHKPPQPDPVENADEEQRTDADDAEAEEEQERIAEGREARDADAKAAVVVYGGSTTAQPQRSKHQPAAPPSDAASSEEDGRGPMSASDGDKSGSGTSGSGDNEEGDYRRGKRFKKLFRLLDSPLAQKHVTRYQVHATLIVVLMAVVQIGMFVLMTRLLANQIAILDDLRMIGLSASAASALAITTRNFNMLYWNLTYDTLRFLNDPVNDMAPLKALYRVQIDEFQELHKGAYLGYTKKRSLPTINGVRALWDTPSLPNTMYYTIAANESLGNFTTQSINTKVVMASLWDLGNQLVIKANNIWLNSDWWVEFYKMDFFDNPDMNYILTNYADGVIVGYLKTLDGLVTYVVENANQVNRVQIILLILEGVVLCVSAVFYVWTLSTRVAAFRYNVYNVFLLVPQGLARALATMRLNLVEEGQSDDEDEDIGKAAGDNTGEEEDGTVAPSAAALAAPKIRSRAASGGRSADKANSRGNPDGGGGGAGVVIRLGAQAGSQGSQALHSATTLSGTMKRVGSALAFWRRRAPVEPNSGKGKAKKVRTLHTSARASWWLVWPFLVWGSVVVIVNGSGYSMLAKISGPVSTYIILNFVTVMYQRTIFTLQELVFEPELRHMDGWRSLTYDMIQSLRREYNVLLLGGAKAAPEETSPHYALVKEGVVSSDGIISAILFSTDDCLCLKKEQCWPPKSKYYEYTHNGLNHLMQHFMELGDTIKDYKDLDPYMNGELFGYYWNTFPDMSGGLSELNRLYHLDVQKVYQEVLNMHIAGLVITLLILVAYILLIMRPFIAEIANETRRVAELLSQLPNEVDVEGVLARLVVTGSTTQRSTSNKGMDERSRGKPIKTEKEKD